jgi:hypothetical protein
VGLLHGSNMNHLMINLCRAFLLTFFRCSR